MADVSIKATLTGFDEGRTSLLAYQDGMKKLEAEAAKLQGALGDAVSSNAFDSAQKYSVQLAELNTRIKDLQVNINRMTPDVSGLSAQQREAAAAAAAASEGMEKAGAAGTHLGLGSAYARRELIILGREAMTGQFSRIPGSMLTLAAHTGMFSAAMLAATVPILAVGAALGVVVYGLVAGKKEMEAMNNAIASTGNFAGITRGEMVLMAESISKSSAITVGAAKDIVTQIVASGRYGSENIEGLTKATENYARITGESVDKAAPKLIKMFEDPYKAAVELNKQYHTLSATELERVRTLQEVGQAQEAVTAAMKVIPDITPEYLRNLGFIETKLLEIKRAFSEVQQAVKGTFSTLTPDEQIAKANAEIARVRAYNPGIKDTDDLITRQKELIRLAEIAKAADKEVSGYKRDAADEIDRQQKGQEMVHKTLQYQSKELQNQLTYAQGFKIIDGERSYNIKDEAERTQTITKLRKEIADNARAQYATTKAMTDAEIAGKEKLFEVQNKGAISAIEAQLKLGRITQEEADRRKAILELEKNYQLQLDTKERLRNPTLSPDARTALEYTLQRQIAEQQILAAQMGQKEQIDKYNLVMKENKLENELALTRIKEGMALQDKQINQAAVYDEAVKKMLEEEEFKLSLIGKTVEQQTLLTALHKLDLDYQKAILNVSDEIKETVTAHYVADKARLTELVRANAEAAKEVNQFWKTAAKDMQRAMSSFFFDVMQGNVKSLGTSFKNMIDKMVADALAAKAALALFGPDFTKPGSTAPIGGLIGQGIGWLGGALGFGGGGSVSSGGLLSASGAGFGEELIGFAGGGSFTVGGSGGTDSQMVGFRATPGERVTVESPGQSRTRGGVHFNGPLIAVYANDPSTFNRSRSQIGAEMFTLAENFARRFR